MVGVAAGHGSVGGLRMMAAQPGKPQSTERRPRGIFALAAALLLAACSTGPSATSPATQSAAGPTPSAAATAAGNILLGGTGPLSQPGDVQDGVPMMWAMEQAVADLNANGGVLGRQLKLLEYDTQDKTDVCATLAAKAVTDGVAGVAGEAHSGCALAEIPTYNAADMPAIFPEAYNDTITAGDPTNPNLPANPPSIFRIAPSSSLYSNFVYDWIKNGLHAKSLLLVYENTDAGINDAKAFKAAFANTDLKLTELSITTGQASYAAIMARAKLDNPNVDVVFFDSGTTGTTYQLTSDGIAAGLVDNAVCLGDTSLRVNDAYWKAVPNGEGCAFEFVGLAPSQFNDLATSLNSRYAAKYGGDAPDYVFQAYDAILLLADAIQRAGTTDHAAVVKALEQTSMTGTVGQYSFPYGSTTPVPTGQPGWLWHQFPNPRLSILEYTQANQPLAQAVTLWPASAQTTAGQAWVSVTR